MLRDMFLFYCLFVLLMNYFNNFEAFFFYFHVTYNNSYVSFSFFEALFTNF